jgi:rhamnosyl/mannosyltransferase
MNKVKKIKILQVNKFYAPWVGGVERIVQLIAESLQEKTAMQILVCQPKGKGCSELYNGVPVVRASSFGILFSMPVSFSFIHKLRKKSGDTDIMQFHAPFPLGDLACLLSGFKGKVIVWWHSEIISQRILAKMIKPIVYAFLKRADMIIVATENHIKGSNILKNFEAKCKIIPFGLDLNAFKGEVPEKYLSRKLTAPDNVKLLFVGRMVYYKGIDVLIEAMKNVTGAELFLVGTGVMEGEYTRLARQNNLEEKVHFLGYLDFDQLKAAYSDCDIFVLPSINEVEAFGIVQLEAMYYGKPVINTNLKTGVPLVSIHNETGLTVEPGDTQALAGAIQRLVDDKELRLKLGANTTKRVLEHYTLDKMIDTLYTEYEKMVGDK